MISHGRDNRTAFFLKQGFKIFFFLISLAASNPALVKPTGTPVWIRLITRDSDTGETIPCRVVIADSLGQYWGLSGPITTQRTFFYTPGDTLLSLYPGNFSATVFRGFEYTPVKDKVFTVPVSANPAPFTLEIPLKRFIHMKELGWYSCDSEVHFFNGSDSPDLRRVYTMQLGEDVNILNIAAYGEGASSGPLYKYLQKDPLPLSIPFYPLVIGEEWRSGAWQNHMILMGLPHRLSRFGNGWFNYPLSPYRFSYPPALDFCDEAHSLGAIVFPCHPFQWNQPWAAPMGDNTELYAAFELPVDVALGKVDGMAIYTFSQQDTWNRLVWYKLLNCGFHVSPFTGTDISDYTGNHVQMGIIGAYPGRVRSYTYIPNQKKDLNFQDWMRETVKGRSFVSSGALVFFTVNGELPGSELKLKSVKGETTVAVRADARWMGGITSVSIMVNGDPVSTENGGGSRQVILDQNIRLSRSSWVAVKVDGAPFINMFNGCAHSGPVYVTLDKRPISSREDALYFVNWIDRHIALLDSTNHFDTLAHKKRTFALYRKGQDVFRKIAQTTVIKGIRMVPIPAGTFQMGSNYEVDPNNPLKGKGSFKGEQPVHSVTVSAFEMSATEVTVGQFREFVDKTGYRTEAERGDGALVYINGKWEKKPDASWKNPYQEQGDDHPVVCVSWNDAAKFCTWLSEKTGQEFQLPTEAEWEYACRAGSTTAYNLGANESDLARAGWYSSNSSSGLNPVGVMSTGDWPQYFISNSSSVSHPVGWKKANAWGIYDMHGNVWEWCNDWHGKNISSNNTMGESDYGRILRGGSCINDTNYCRSAVRSVYPSAQRDNSTGFRVVRRVSP